MKSKMKPEELKKLRQKAGLSTAEAALQTHITQRSWLRYESGDRVIPEGIIELFCIKNDIEYPLN